MKFYAVKNGRNPGVYTSWEECRGQVNGFSGAVYKSFASREEAERFMRGEPEKATCIGVPAAYVDGSYNIKTGEFSFGAVLLDGEEMQTYSEKFSDAGLAAMRNVAGELKGAEFVMRYCVEHGIKNIDIYYDYEGIAAWAQGRWKTNKDGTKAYKEFYDSIKTSVSVNFIKVKGHSGDKYNDMADELAKKAVGNPI